MKMFQKSETQPCTTIDVTSVEIQAIEAQFSEEMDCVPKLRVELSSAFIVSCDDTIHDVSLPRVLSV